MELVRLVFHEVEASEGFAGWLAASGSSLAVTNGNRLFLVGVGPDAGVAVVEQEFPGAAAVAAGGPGEVVLATRYQIWRLHDALPPGASGPGGHDRLFLPQTAWTTGWLLVHQLLAGGSHGFVFVNGRFSCLATVDERLSFRPLWLPPFVSALAPEDRCHLTGVAGPGGEPAFATCAAAADTARGWQADRAGGGLVLTVPGGEVVAAGLSVPHSPVLDGDRLWVANGGAGELGLVDPAGGGYQAVAVLPGFTRGLALTGRWAVVGVSKPARGETFAGLPLADRLPAAGPSCGVFVVDTATGRVEHRLLLHGVAPEINDVAVLPGARWPTVAGFQGDDVQEWVTYPGAATVD